MNPKDKLNQFNIRVYGLFINEKGEILLTDEERFGMRMTKFPGGGLRFGEGTIECLKREALEEFGQEIEIIRHYYTTDFYQKALFYDNQQLISVYYLARFCGPEHFRLAKKAFDFNTDQSEIVSFRYIKMNELSEEELSFPVDRVVLRMLKADYDVQVN
jgi:ADP-ribose pyrophosphatase YjhB (NUDIX family)